MSGYDESWEGPIGYLLSVLLRPGIFCRVTVCSVSLSVIRDKAILMVEKAVTIELKRVRKKKYTR